MDDKERILQALEQGNYKTTLHAKQRMAQRMISDNDIIECGRTARSIK